MYGFSDSSSQRSQCLGLLQFSPARHGEAQLKTTADSEGTRHAAVQNGPQRRREEIMSTLPNPSQDRQADK